MTDSRPDSFSDANAAGHAGYLRFSNLDVLRGVAALIVILVHYDSEVWRPLGASTFFYDSASYLAVDFFILLSGFVLAHAYFERPDFSPRSFLLRRISRFWPLHVTGLALMLALFAFTHHPVHQQSLVANAFLIHALGPGHAALGFNAPSWSLSVELGANMLVAAIFLLTPRKEWIGRILLGLSLACMAYLFFGPGHMHVIQGHVFNSSLLQEGCVRGLATFPLGILTYRFFMTHRRSIESFSAFNPFFLGLVLTAFMGSFLLPGETLMDFVAILLYMAVILLMAPTTTIWTRWLRGLRGLGNLSFSLYITHFFVVSVYAATISDALPYMLGLPIVIAASLMLSWTANRFIEKPVYAWLIADNRPALLTITPRMRERWSLILRGGLGFR